MSLRLYDTLTGEKRAFESVHPGKAGMYVCGMTVQDKPHVGHIRSSIVGDTLRRWLDPSRLRGDVRLQLHRRGRQDHRARERGGLAFRDVAERNIDAYLRYADLHNIQRAIVLPEGHRAHRRDARADRHADRARASRTRRAATCSTRCASARTTASCRAATSTTCARAAGSRSTRRSATRSTLRSGRARSPGEPAWETPVWPRPPGLAHRVLGDGDEVSRASRSTFTAAGRT